MRPEHPAGALVYDAASRADEGLVYDVDGEEIGEGDPHEVAGVFAHLGGDGRAPRGLPPLELDVAKLATSGAAGPVDPGLLSMGARPSAKEGNPIAPLTDLIWKIMGGGVANAPGDAEEAKNGAKSMTDTEHLKFLLSMGASALAGGAAQSAMARQGASTMMAAATGGAAAGVSGRAVNDAFEGEVSSPGAYLGDAFGGAVMGGVMGSAGSEAGAASTEAESEATISSPRARARGNPRAIANAGAKLSKRQQRLLAKLSGSGSKTMVPKSGVSQNDLAALTAATGDEFTFFTRGPQRMVMRGGPGKIPVGEREAAQMSKAGWRWSAHTHPDGALRSSLGDRAVLAAFGNKLSAILDGLGGRSLFSAAGDSLKGWLPR